MCPHPVPSGICLRCRQLIQRSGKLEVGWEEVVRPWQHQSVRMLDRHLSNAGDVTDLCTQTTTTLTFNGLLSWTVLVSRHQKGKPFWILLEQGMMWWQW